MSLVVWTKRIWIGDTFVVESEMMRESLRIVRAAVE